MASRGTMRHSWSGLASYPPSREWGKAVHGEAFHRQPSGQNHRRVCQGDIWLQGATNHQQRDPNPGDEVGAQLRRHSATKSLSECVCVCAHAHAHAGVCTGGNCWLLNAQTPGHCPGWMLQEPGTQEPCNHEAKLFSYYNISLAPSVHKVLGSNSRIKIFQGPRFTFIEQGNKWNLKVRGKKQASAEAVQSYL